METLSDSSEHKEENALQKRRMQGLLCSEEKAAEIFEVLQNSMLYTPPVIKEQFVLFYKMLEQEGKESWGPNDLKKFNGSMYVTLRKAFGLGGGKIARGQVKILFSPSDSLITFQKQHNKGMYTPEYVIQKMQKDFPAYLKSNSIMKWSSTDLDGFDPGISGYVQRKFKISKKVCDRDKVIKTYFFTQEENSQEIPEYAGLTFSPEKTYYNDEKIKKVFKNFALELDTQQETSWGPTDFETFNGGLYLHLLDHHRIGPKEIDWATILEKYVDKNLAEKFDKTYDYYNDTTLPLHLQKFFDHIDGFEQETWSITDLRGFNDSLYANLLDAYKPKNREDREAVFLQFASPSSRLLNFCYEEHKDFALIAQERFADFFSLLGEKKARYRTPKNLEIFDRNFYEYFKRNFRDEEGNVDRFILYTFVKDHSLINKFRHRFDLNFRFISPVSKKKNFFELENNRGVADLTPNIEDSLIEEEIFQEQKTALYRLIKKLSQEEQKVIATFLNEGEVEQQDISHIIDKLKSLRQDSLE